MEKFVLLMAMFATYATYAAATEDLSGKVFVFPRDSDTDSVKLPTNKTQLNSVTVCLRFFTDLSRKYGLFSLSAPTSNNEFLIFKKDTEDAISLYVHGTGVDFLSLSFPPNTWHSMCTTWRSDNGLAQLWVDGKATIKRFINSGPINGALSIILGQDQDSYGGGFQTTQSYVGMITKVHMWDYVLPSTEIKRYMNDKHFTPGNVFKWKALDYKVSGKVLVEEIIEQC